MLRYQVLTLFPEMIENQVHQSIIGRAIRNGILSVETINIRDFSQDRNGRVDDYPYGGGAGMVMEAEPVYRAVREARKRASGNPRVVYLTPQAKVLTQTTAEELALENELILLCGHYEGIDERVLDECVTDYISIGDYVLTGGELGAMVLIDAVSRFVPGVLGNETSSDFESMQDHLLEYPHFTRPEVWHDKKVPEVLLSGDHAKVESWRHEQSVARTSERRPDLLETGTHFTTLFLGDTGAAAERLSAEVSRYGECLDYNRRKLQKEIRKASGRDFYLIVIPEGMDAEDILEPFRNLKGNRTRYICLSVPCGMDSASGGCAGPVPERFVSCGMDSPALDAGRTRCNTSLPCEMSSTDRSAALPYKPDGAGKEPADSLHSFMETRGFQAAGADIIPPESDREQWKRLSLRIRKTAEKYSVPHPAVCVGKE